MAITKEFLRDQMYKLETNYGKEKFSITQDIFDLWFEMFEECDEKGLSMAVDNCIKDSEFAPNIAGLMKYYKELDAERRELGELILHQYTTIRSIWGEDFDKSTFDAIVTYVFRFPKKLRKIEMVELTHRAISFFHDCEVAGRTDTPTIKQYLEGAR